MKPNPLSPLDRANRRSKGIIPHRLACGKRIGRELDTRIRDIRIRYFAYELELSLCSTEQIFLLHGFYK
jgi:hypothetical protein